jgi:hypothetical protein
MMEGSHEIDETYPAKAALVHGPMARREFFYRLALASLTIPGAATLAGVGRTYGQSPSAVDHSLATRDFIRSISVPLPQRHLPNDRPDRPDVVEYVDQYRNRQDIVNTNSGTLPPAIQPAQADVPPNSFEEEDITDLRYEGQPAVFDDLGGVLFAGALVQGRALNEDGTLGLINLPRAPGVLGLTDATEANFGDQHFKDLDVVDLRHSIEATRELSRNIVGPARFQFIEKECFSSEQTLFDLGARASWLTGDASTNLKTKTNVDKSKFASSITQIYFTMTFQSPTDEIVLAKNVTVDDAGRWMGEGNPPLYVSQVLYGRRFVLVASSDESQEALDFIMHAAVSYGVADASTDLSVSEKRILQETEISALVFGGPPGPQLRAVGDIRTDRREALRQMLISGADYQSGTAVPIFYRLKYVSLDGEAPVGLTTSYHLKRKKGKRVKELLLQFQTVGDDKDVEITVSVDVLTAEKDQIGHYEFRANEFWDNGSTQEQVHISLDRHPYWFEVEDALLRVRLNRGDLGWEYVYTLSAVFEDDTKRALPTLTATSYLGDDSPIENIHKIMEPTMIVK